jgi:hypothetical protein
MNDTFVLKMYKLSVARIERRDLIVNFVLSVFKFQVPWSWEESKAGLVYTSTRNIPRNPDVKHVGVGIPGR